MDKLAECIKEWMCCCFATSPESSEIDRAIERELRRIKHESSREVKLLLLGSGESGKSTFIKQMKIIHGQGFSVNELRSMRTLVFSNAIDAVNNLDKGMNLLNMEYENDATKESAQKIVKSDVSQGFSADLASLIDKFWSDKAVRACYERRNEFYLGDSAAYFLEQTQRFCDSEFVPSEEDLLRARAPTTSIQEYSFELDNGIRFRFVDVGGQRSERRKWIHVFEAITAIVFLVALSEYDQRLLEENSVNRLEESRALFKTILDYKWFERSSLILFLNKIDLFEDKIRFSHLSKHFPEFEGPEGDVDAAKTFIASMFITVADNNKNNGEDARNVYSFETCATDTENIRLVFMAVKDTILQNNLLEYNLA